MPAADRAGLEDELRRYTARGIRTFRSSPAFELTLRYDASDVAVVTNDGRGGSHRWEPVPAKRVRDRNDVGYAERMAVARGAKAKLGELLAAALPEEAERADSIVSCMADGSGDGANALKDWLAVG